MTNGGHQSGPQRDFRPTPPDDFFRSLVAASPDAIVSVTTDGTIRYANDAVEQIFGYAPDDLHGESVGLLLPDRFHESFARQAQEYLTDGVKPINWDGAELVAEHADGSEIPVSVTIVEHRVRDQQRFTAVVRDITRRMEREDDLVRENAQLREAFANLQASLSGADAALAEARNEYDGEDRRSLDAAHDRVRDARRRARRHARETDADESD